LSRFISVITLLVVISSNRLARKYAWCSGILKIFRN
jgi:hypothetical protein